MAALQRYAGRQTFSPAQDRARFLALALSLVLAGCGGSDPASRQSVAALQVQGGAVPQGTVQGAGAAQGGAPEFAATFTGNVGQYVATQATTGDLAWSIVDATSGQTVTAQAGSRLNFRDGALALDLNGNAGKIYRLYQATFNRKPDLIGLGFYLSAVDNNLPWMDVANSVISSVEFSSRYGALNNRNFLIQIYRNVLLRDPDEGGLAFYLGYLDGTHPGGVVISRAEVLLSISESVENQALVQPSIRNGIEYLPWTGSVPVATPAIYKGTYQLTLGSDKITLVVSSEGALQGGGRLDSTGVDVVGSTTFTDGGRFALILAGANSSLTVVASINSATGLIVGNYSNGVQAGGFMGQKVVVVDPQPAMFPGVQAIIKQRCLPCHSVRTTQPGFPVAQAGVTFDNETQIRSRASDILQVAVQSQSMPFGNATGMTQAERATLKAWFDAGTP